MGCVPVARLDVVQVATPETRPTAPQLAISTPLSRKATFPVGAPRLPESVAVKVIVSPVVAGFFDEASAIAGATGAADTVCVSAADDDAEYAPLPEYTAVMEWEPTPSDD